MYNTDIPSKEDLPTIRQLNRSSLIAVCIGALLYVVAYLPAEYGIDPTGLGSLTGLKEMGEIKVQLKNEADADQKHSSSSAVPPARTLQADSSRSLFSRLFIGSALAHEEGHGPGARNRKNGDQSVQAPSNTSGRTDEMSVTLKPGQGAEIKLIMKKGAKANYSWTVIGGTANYDLHGDGPGRKSKSYKRGRSVPGDNGVLEAEFTGNHGWFWRNRTRKNVTVKLWVNGEYSDIKRMM